MKIKSNITDKASRLEYINIFLLIVCSGSLINLILFRYTMILFLFISIYHKWKCRGIKKNQSRPLLFILLSLIVITTIIHGTSGNTIIALFINIIGAYATISSYSLNKFKRIYLNVTFFLCLTSIFIYIGSHAYLLPISQCKMENVTIMYSFFHTIGWNGMLFNRIAGIFTVPGAYQFCLNFALVLFLEDIKTLHLKKNEIYKIGTIIFTIILCGSTIGYLVLITIIIYTISRLKIKYKAISLPLIALIAFWGIKGLVLSDNISGKFSQEGEGSSLMMRQADNIALLQMISDSPILGNGIKSNIYNKKSEKYGNNTSSNGVLAAIASIGIGWLIFYIIYCYKASKKMYRDVSPIIIIGITLLIQTNENFSFMPFIFIFLFQFNSYENKVLNHHDLLQQPTRN